MELAPKRVILEFTRDGASGGPKIIVWTVNENIVYPNLHVDRIGEFSV